MTTDTIVNTLLDAASIQQCEKLAEKADLQGKRAKALLALNNGDSNSVAAEKSGLTAGQVSYMINRFKKIGMELFNASTTKKAAVKKAVRKKAVTKPAAVIENTETDDQNIESASDSEAEAEVKNKDKKKKTKKDKSKKESKKDKKDKKNSKMKKSKKGKK